MVRELDNCNSSNCSFMDTVYSHNLTPFPPSEFTLGSSSSLSAEFNSYPHIHEESTQQRFFEFLSKPSYCPPSRKRQRSPSSGLVLQHKDLARDRRKKISDRTRSLQKLMPWDKKMDIATTLEEAYKYVKYLQAQVLALSSMPIDSSFVLQDDHDVSRFGGEVGGELAMLNRQQLLQVLVTSPAAQTMLYSKGFCVFSLEQLLFMNKLSEINILMQQCSP